MSSKHEVSPELRDRLHDLSSKGIIRNLMFSNDVESMHVIGRLDPVIVGIEVLAIFTYGETEVKTKDMQLLDVVITYIENEIG